jgi:integrase/recombinase XerD
MKGFRDPNTMIQSIWAMNRFFDYIGRPDLKQKTKKPKKREVVPLTDAEMMSLMETIRTMSKFPTRNARNYAIAVGLMDTAARNGEMTNLKRTDVDFDRKVVILKNTKSGDDQYLPLTPEFEAAILEYLSFRPKGKTPEDDEYLFLTKGHKKMETGDTWGMVRMAGFKAGIQRPIWPHLLRHSRLDQLARTMTLPDLQKVSRHANIETLMRYVHAGSKEVARQVQDLSLFNKVRVIDLPSDDMTEKTVTRSKPPREDAKVQFALLNAQLLKEGRIDAETYKSALTVLK